MLENGCCDDEVRVQLYEARPGDPAVPQGKAFATISSVDLGLPPHSEASCKNALLKLVHPLPGVSSRGPCIQWVYIDPPGLHILRTEHGLHAALSTSDWTARFF